MTTKPRAVLTPYGQSVFRIDRAQGSVCAHHDHPSAAGNVERLLRAGFPSGRTAVAGTALRDAPRARGRLSALDVTGRGLVSGLLVGVALGWLLQLLDLTSAAVPAVWLLVNTAALGAVLGIAVAVLDCVITRGRRSFEVAPTAWPAHYDVMVDAELADDAATKLRPTRPDKRQLFGFDERGTG